MTIAFGRSYGGYAQSFYFVTFLFPIILGTSIFFNSFLVQKYLLSKQYLKFIQYSIYTLIFSVYLEILVLTLSLVVFENYQYEQLNPKTTDILFLTVIMYFLVFLNTIILLLREYFKGLERNKVLEIEHNKINRGYITVISARKNINISFESISHIESVGNYVKIHPISGKTILSKQKISNIENNLPNMFLRIHRSIIININQITSFNREWIIIDDLELPISRKYKVEVLRKLQS